MTVEQLLEQLHSIDPRDRHFEVRVVTYPRDRRSVSVPLKRISGPGISGPLNLVGDEETWRDDAS